MVLSTEGRDKLSKVFQYGSRFLMDQNRQDKEKHLMYKNLFGQLIRGVQGREETIQVIQKRE